MDSLENVAIHRQNKLNAEILTPECLKFLAILHRNFNKQRRELLEVRKVRQEMYNKGQLPCFPPETQHIRDSVWKVAPYPK